MCPTQTARVFATSALMILAAAGPLTGQWRAEPIVPVAGTSARAVDPPALRLPDSRQSTPPDDYTLTLAGIASAAVGALGGAYLGYKLDYNGFNWGCEHGCEDPGLLGAVGGWFIGSALTTPLGVHLANGSRGDLSRAYVSSGVIAGVGLGALFLVGSPAGAIPLWGAPLAQVVSAVVIERRGRP